MVDSSNGSIAHAAHPAADPYSFSASLSAAFRYFHGSSLRFEPLGIALHDAKRKGVKAYYEKRALSVHALNHDDKAARACALFEKLQGLGIAPKEWHKTGAALYGTRRHVNKRGEIEENTRVYLSLDLGHGVEQFFGFNDLVGQVAGSINAVEVVTGICIFSAKGASAVLEDGSKLPLTSPRGEKLSKKVLSLEIDKDLSFYEHESLVKLSWSTGLFAKSMPGEIKVHLNLPRIEYYCYVLDAYNSGLISSEIATEWIAAVDARAKVLEKAEAEMVESIAPGKVKFQLDEALAPAEGYIKESIAARKPVLLEEVKHILSGSGETWAQVLQQAAFKNGPKTFTDLNYLSYVVVYLSAAASAGPNTAIMAIENETEEAIFKEAREMAWSLEKASGRKIGGFAAMYAHTMVLDTEACLQEGRQNKHYYNEAEPEEYEDALGVFYPLLKTAVRQ